MKILNMYGVLCTLKQKNLSDLKKYLCMYNIYFFIVKLDKIMNDFHSEKSEYYIIYIYFTTIGIILLQVVLQVGTCVKIQYKL